MKKYIIFITALLSISLAKSQTPLTQAIDFSSKDVDGVTHHLFDLLDNQNQYVLIDFFNPY